ncbi:aldehyde dehydrogenase family protein [Pontibacillus yanchengensis]|uniref:Aldehyde dehydrogenase family protein n=1 Tax=Pontibacillus yanchengensis TaxID=462910 RepID=A0ACC7VKN7_9BACI|nr:aldehyde dehydrogenase family protein [Pontibacillus yanchengensis]MYL54685.1 aldehyde dehydrogenase family protein [Pontibacillus yanchengensis]
MTTKTAVQSMYLAGEWKNREAKIDVLNSHDQSLIASVPSANKEDMLFAIEEAKEGREISSELPIHERMTILQRAADYVEEHMERYAKTIALEGSKTIQEARGEVKRSVETIRISAEEARRITGETISFDQHAGSEDRVGYYYQFPVGIIGAITPFNDPLNLVAHKVGPAIASGNAIIVKPASVTPLSALLLAEALDYAGLPNKILSVVTGSGREVGDTLVTHPAIRKISFTGGLETGQKLASQAGLKKINMELGSNSPVIVLDDAILEEAVPACVSGSFAAAGQNCIGVQRIYVQEEVYHSFEQQFIKETSTYNYGDKLLESTDMGPMINENEAIRVEEWVSEAVEKGADLLIGGEREGAYYQPTVLANVPGDCMLAKEEIFGPVVLLYAVSTLEEAIDRSNNVNYGLHAGIFTENLEHAFEAISRLQVGGVMINDSSDYRIDAMPFGGVKGSGIGREGVKASIQEMTEPRVVNIKLKHRKKV